MSGQFSSNSPPSSLHSITSPSSTKSPSKRARADSNPEVLDTNKPSLASSVLAAASGLMSSVSSLASSIWTNVTNLFKPIAPTLPPPAKKQRVASVVQGDDPSVVERRLKNLSDHKTKLIEAAEAMQCLPNTERSSQTITDNDRLRVVTLSLEFGWVLTVQGENTTTNTRIAKAAVRQASAQLGFLDLMVKSNRAHQNVRSWYLQFHGCKLDPLRKTNRGRASIADTYGNVRLVALWREAVKVLKDWASFEDLAMWIQGHTKGTDVPVVVSGSSLRRWFVEQKGKVTRMSSKPELSKA